MISNLETLIILLSSCILGWITGFLVAKVVNKFQKKKIERMENDRDD